MKPLTWLRSRTAGVPRWVLLHLVLVVAATAAGAYAGWVGEPDILFADFDDVPIDPPIRFLTDLWSSKNIAYLVIIGATLLLRAPIALGAVLGMKFVNDSLDQLVFTPTHLDASVASMLPAWLVMTVPMGIAAWLIFIQPTWQASRPEV